MGTYVYIFEDIRTPVKAALVKPIILKIRNESLQLKFVIIKIRTNGGLYRL
jgi:hypothetical protein